MRCDTVTGMSTAERDLAELARGQGGVFSRTQVAAVGLSRSAVAHRLNTGRWVVVQGRILAASSSELGAGARLWAAILTAGPRTVLSHRSAGQLWQLGVCDDGPVELITTARRTPTITGAVVRRRVLEPDEVTELRGLAVTSRERTLLDCLATLPLADAEALLDQAWRHGLITPPALRGCVEQWRGRVGTEQLRLLADEMRSTRAWEPYTRLAHTLQTAGVRGWGRDVHVPTPDGVLLVRLGFPRSRLAVHVGDRYRPDGAVDGERQNALSRVGWRVVHVRWFDAMHDRRRSVELVREGLEIARANGVIGAP